MADLLENSLRPGRRRKFRKGPNTSEVRLMELAREAEVGVTRRGFPDFAVVKDGQIVGFIEVKRSRKTNLRPSQEIFQVFCDDHNIPFAVWDPETPFPRFAERA